MGVMLVVLIFILFLAILIVSLIRFCKCSSKLHSVFLKVKKKLFWNTFLRYALTSSLKTSISVTAALSMISFSDTKRIADAVVSITLITILVALPFFFAYLLQRNKTELTKQWMRDKIGSLYLGFKVSTFGERLNSSVFLTRRLLFATLTAVCTQNPNILIHVFLASNLLYFLYLGIVRPNETKSSQR